VKKLLALLTIGGLCAIGCDTTPPAKDNKGKPAVTATPPSPKADAEAAPGAKDKATPADKDKNAPVPAPKDKDGK
jgi:hypothetical protein